MKIFSEDNSRMFQNAPECSIMTIPLALSFQFVQILEICTDCLGWSVFLPDVYFLICLRKLIWKWASRHPISPSLLFLSLISGLILCTARPGIIDMALSPMFGDWSLCCFCLQCMILHGRLSVHRHGVVGSNCARWEITVMS